MKSSAKFLALVTAVAALAASAYANTVTVVQTSGYAYGGGGEFTITPNGGDPDGLLNDYPVGVNGTNINGVSFESFCLQKGESLSGHPMYYGISYAAQGTHTDLAGNATDHISAGTAWLFGQFAQGILFNYNYSAGAGRVASANLLQQAIWYLEDEITLSAYDLANNVFLNNATSGAINHYGSLAAAKADSSPAQGVRVLNLATTQANADARIWDAQDQLIWPRVPDQGTTIALLGLAFFGLAAFRSKFSK